MRSFEELVAEADSADIRGWGFGWLDGRAIEERPPGVTPDCWRSDWPACNRLWTSTPAVARSSQRHPGCRRQWWSPTGGHRMRSGHGTSWGRGEYRSFRPTAVGCP